MVIHPLRESIDQVTVRFTIILLGAATFVLLLACANVANLQLARSTAREREIGLRAALGASRIRIARELLTESLVIGMLGGCVGMLLANWDLHITKAAIPAQVFRWVAGLKTWHMDASTVVFGFALSVAAGVACSLPAIYQLLRSQGHAGLNDVLKEGGRTSSSGTSRSRARSTLVVVEVALSLVLLIGAGLMVRTFQRILALDLGFDPKNMLITDIWLSDRNYRDDAQMARFFTQVLDRLNAVPGVESAAGAGDIGGAATLSIEGQRSAAARSAPRHSSLSAPATSIPCVFPCAPGRSIGTQDGPNAAPVVVVSEAVVPPFLARRESHWPQNPSQRTRLSVADHGRSMRRPEGLVQREIRSLPFTFPTSNGRLSYMGLHIRTRQDPLQFAASVRAQVRAVDANQAISNIETEEQSLAEETSGVRCRGHQDEHLRCDLSLTRHHGLLRGWLFFRRAPDAGDWYPHDAGRHARRYSQHGAYPDRPHDRDRPGRGARASHRYDAGDVARALQRCFRRATTFVALTALLAASALLAGYIPAYRAARIDPMAALRNE